MQNESETESALYYVIFLQDVFFNLSVSRIPRVFLIMPYLPPLPRAKEVKHLPELHSCVRFSQ